MTTTEERTKVESSVSAEESQAQRRPDYFIIEDKNHNVYLVPSSWGGEPVQEVESEISELHINYELKELDNRLPKITGDYGANNAEWCYWRDNTAQALCTTITSAIYGDGVTVVSDNQEVVKIINEFNEKVNHENLSIADLIHQSFEDNVMHGLSVWFKRLEEQEDGTQQLAIIKTDPKEIDKIRHPKTGWVKFIQKSYTDQDLPAKLDDFNSDKYDPQYKYSTALQKVHLSSDEVVWFDFFRKPPIRSVTHLIVFKLQIATFMRTAAKKFAGPVPVVKIGTEEFYNQNIDEYQEEINDAAKTLAKWKNFDGVATPWYWDVEVLETATKVMDFTDKLEWIDKQIARALFGSIALFEASGSELATSRTIERVMLRRIDYFRKKYELSLKPLYEEVLLLNDLENQEFSLEWTPLTEEDRAELVNSVINLFNAGILLDKNEARRQLAPVMDLAPIPEPEEPEYTPPPPEEGETDTSTLSKYNPMLKPPTQQEEEEAYTDGNTMPNKEKTKNAWLTH